MDQGSSEAWGKRHLGASEQPTGNIYAVVCKSLKSPFISLYFAIKDKCKWSWIIVL